MNDQILTEMRMVVERAVRPVRASDARKLRMRQELLDHLAAIYEEELERLGNEAAALTRAQERFGDPHELTDELRRSLSWFSSVQDFLSRSRSLASKWDRPCMAEVRRTP